MTAGSPIPGGDGPPARRRGGPPAARAARRLLSWALLGAVACSGRDEKAAVDAAPPAPPAPATQRAARDAAAPDPAALARLFPGPKPALPSPLAPVRFDLTREAVYAAVPALRGRDVLSPDGAAGVRLRVAFHREDDRLRYVRVDLPAEAGAYLARVWGEGTRAAAIGGLPGRYWFDEAAGLQAILIDRGHGRSRLTFWPWLPARRLLGGDRRALGIEQPGTPLLGSSPEKVLAAYARWRPERTPEGHLELKLPPHEYRTTPTTLALTVERGKVTAVAFDLRYDAHPPLRETFEAAFRALLGEPTATDGREATYAGTPTWRIRQLDLTRRFAVRITPE